MYNRVDWKGVVTLSDHTFLERTVVKGYSIRLHKKQPVVLSFKSTQNPEHTFPKRFILCIRLQQNKTIIKYIL